MFTIIKELLFEDLPKNLYRVYIFLVIVQTKNNIIFGFDLSVNCIGCLLWKYNCSNCL